MPRRSRSSSATSSGSSRRAASAASRTFSRTVRSPNGSRRWNVRARPRRARLNGASFVTSCAVDADTAAERRLETADDVEQRRLAGAVRADETGDHARLGGEVDRVEGEPAAEADADAGDLERAHPASTASSGSAASPRAASSSRTSAARERSGRSRPTRAGWPPRAECGAARRARRSVATRPAPPPMPNRRPHPVIAPTTARQPGQRPATRPARPSASGTALRTA